jgi:hypothetical protein
MLPQSRDAVALLEERLTMLLQDLLARIRRARETPLEFGLDSAAIARAAWRVVLSGLPDAPSLDGQAVTAGLDRLVQEAIQDEYAVPGVDSGRVQDDAIACIDAGDALAAWLEQLLRVQRAVHPRALEILALRLEGCQDREIALRLGFGLRLVRRILGDLRAAREASTR